MLASWLRRGGFEVIEAGTVAHPERMASGVLAAGLRGTIGTWGWDIEIGPYAADVPQWVDNQLAKGRAASPEALLKTTANNIATQLYGSPHRWREVKPVLERYLDEAWDSEAGGAA